MLKNVSRAFPFVEVLGLFLFLRRFAPSLILPFCFIMMVLAVPDFVLCLDLNWREPT